MVKVLIYGSKQIYDNAPFEGRAEANVIAYREGPEYVIVKNRTSRYLNDRIPHFTMARNLDWIERDEWNNDLESHRLQEKYVNHPYTTLMKNEQL